MPHLSPPVSGAPPSSDWLSAGWGTFDSCALSARWDSGKTGVDVSSQTDVPLRSWRHCSRPARRLWADAGRSLWSSEILRNPHPPPSFCNSVCLCVCVQPVGGGRDVLQGRPQLQSWRSRVQEAVGDAFDRAHAVLYALRDRHKAKLWCHHTSQTAANHHPETERGVVWNLSDGSYRILTGTKMSLHEAPGVTSVKPGEAGLV